MTDDRVIDRVRAEIARWYPEADLTVLFAEVDRVVAQRDAERALADDLYVAGEEVEKEWIVRGDGGCNLRERAKFSAALARYRGGTPMTVFWYIVAMAATIFAAATAIMALFFALQWLIRKL